MNATESLRVPEPHCAYFEEEDTDWNDTIFWKFDGCKIDDNATELVAKCSCTHTTSFSVLLSIGTPRPPTLWDEIGSVVTKVGLSISIVALVCALLIYFVLRSTISSARYAIHSNLMVSLLLVAVVFLSLIDRTEPKVKCFARFTCTDGLTLLIFLPVMLCPIYHVPDGYILRSCSPRSCCANLPHTCCSICFCLHSVGCWLRVSICTGRLSPSLNLRRNIPGFTLPLAGINLCILIRVTLVVVKAVKFQAEKESSEKVTQVKAGVRSALLLMPLLGSTHLLSILASNNGVMQILNDVLNSLQGLFVALFYCAMNSEVRNAISQYIRRSKDASTIQGSTTGVRKIYLLSDFTSSI
ncbi:Latrophilin-2 [Apostichopus japonicus]|uniref:Latrophilin-2 n=1 Tax=Stichopus japonicus TaxID=307972 RepID=A0A2G8JGS2_STIJA|nr:Latrophilin-2 [Apostichopus japonicus]